MKNQSSIINHPSSIKKVLIVDDSPTVREYLSYIINRDVNLKVVGMAGDGEEAIKLVKMNDPDVVIMDIQMPKMDGYEATRQIMQKHPVPIVIVSAGLNTKDVTNSFRAMQAGAVAALKKPQGPGHLESEGITAKLVQTVKLMSEVKVVRRIPQYQKTETSARLPSKVEVRRLPARIEIVAIGVSTGGPPVIRTILSKLTKNFPVPILIVQHIAAGFLQGMVEWLDKETPLSVQIPKNGDRARSGNVYFAPEGYHMGITGGGEIVFSSAAPENGVKPSVSYLFCSVTRAFGEKAVGVILTGMGKDGVLELKEMKDRGAITVAQDKESSIIHGMPGDAIKIGAATHVLSPEEIAAFLGSTVKKHDH